MSVTLPVPSDEELWIVAGKNGVKYQQEVGLDFKRGVAGVAHDDCCRTDKPGYAWKGGRSIL